MESLYIPASLFLILAASLFAFLPHAGRSPWTFMLLAGGHSVMGWMAWRDDHVPLTIVCGILVLLDFTAAFFRIRRFEHYGGSHTLIGRHGMAKLAGAGVAALAINAVALSSIQQAAKIDPQIAVLAEQQRIMLAESQKANEKLRTELEAARATLAETNQKTKKSKKQA